MKKIILTILIFISSNILSAQSNHFVFLFDNSGSMQGLYREQISAFKPFSKALMKNSLNPNDVATIMLFNKTEPKREIKSPKILFDDNAKNLVLDQVMDNFKMMRGSDGQFGVTDIIEALDGGIETIKENTAIIWIVTDNINDISGSGDSSYFNTLEFYKRLRNDEKIKKILLYPVPERVTENGLTSNGYVVYGIVYSKDNLSQPELEKYDKILRGVGIKQKAITLKPLDIGTIVLNPKVTQSKISPGKLYYDGKALKGFGFEEGEKIKETFNDLTLKSNLYPYIIKSAKLDVHLDNFVSSDYSVKSLGTQSISPSTVSNVSPEGEVTGFSVIFNMPEITPNFSFKTIFKEDFSIGGNLVLEVSQVDIVLDENYMKNFSELFALQSVPEIFKPVLKDKKIITHIPLEIKMKYGPWRLFVLIGLLVVIIGLVVVLVFLLLKKKCFAIVLNNKDYQSVCLSAISSYSVNYESSMELGKIKKSLFGDIGFIYSKFTTTPNVSVKLANGVQITIEYEENLTKNTVTLMINETVKKEIIAEGSKEDFY
jgi:hypothetical protein